MELSQQLSRNNPFEKQYEITGVNTIEQLNEEIATTNAEIAEKQSKLDSLYFDDSYYIARSVRDSLNRFVKLYLSTAGTGLSTSLTGGSRKPVAI